jgi:hypothetical protein
MADRDIESIEAGTQPDPMLQPGRAAAVRIWITVIGAIAVLTLTFYGLTQNPAEMSVAQSNTGSANPTP